MRYEYEREQLLAAGVSLRYEYEYYSRAVTKTAVWYTLHWNLLKKKQPGYLSFRELIHVIRLPSRGVKNTINTTVL